MAMGKKAVRLNATQRALMARHLGLFARAKRECRRKLVFNDISDDQIHDRFMDRFLHCAATWEPAKGAFEVFVLTHFKYVLLDLLRGAKPPAWSMDTESEDDDLTAHERLADDASPAFESVVHRSLEEQAIGRLVEKALAPLSERDRELVVMMDGQELTVPEAMATLAINGRPLRRGTLRVYLHRARRALQARLTDEDRAAAEAHLVSI